MTFVRTIGTLALSAIVLGPMIGCREKGPVEKAGEKVDEAAEKLKDAVDPKGPAEKLGEKVDKATGH